jgi:hypothetical protein
MERGISFDLHLAADNDQRTAQNGAALDYSRSPSI